MKNIFELRHTEEILTRIDNLSSNSQRQWGQMNVAQMLAHCSGFQDIATGNSLLRRSWLGIVIGPLVKPVFYNDKPLPRDMSTIPTILVADEREFEQEREILRRKTIAFQENGQEHCTNLPHPFFGKLTAEQWGKGIYKHLDHHLKQFGV
ncbi:MAG: DUF1569 domain-containing protein [Gorillibacterium sp.]|nr:DUF1569 domain-containing protein [Gorillibacterium sp.]